MPRFTRSLVPITGNLSHNTNVEKTPSRRCKSKEAPETNNLALQISDNVKGNLNELQDFNNQ